MYSKYKIPILLRKKTLVSVEQPNLEKVDNRSEKSLAKGSVAIEPVLGGGVKSLGKEPPIVENKNGKIRKFINFQI